MAQQQRGAQDRADRVADSAASNVRRRAMDRLVESTPGVAQRSGRQQTQRARQHRCLVGQDVTEQIFGEQYVEVARPAQQMHGGRIDEHMVDRDLRKLLSDDTFTDLTPQLRRFKHVGLVDLRDPLTTRLRKPPSDPCNPLDLGHGIGALVDRPIAVA